MPKIVLKTAGTQSAVAFANGYIQGLDRMRRSTAYVTSRLPYAWGIEFGRHRVSGRLARRTGGASYLRRAIDAVLGNARADLSEGMERVRRPGPWVLLRLARWVRRLGRQSVPRRRGALRRSIRAEVVRRGA